MRLKYQIFLALLAASAVLIAIMFAVSSWNFNRGFLEYVNKNEKSRLAPVAEELAFQFEEHGNWNWVDSNTLHQVYGSLTRRQRAANRSPTRDSDSPANDPETRPNDPPQRQRFRNSSQLVLADTDYQYIIGDQRRSDNISWIPINQSSAKTDDENIVGYLGYRTVTNVAREFDQAFERKQKRDFVWSALAMVLLSALLSIPLASLIVRPLLKVNNAVNEVSGGNFKYRIKNQRRDELGDLANNINSLGLTLEENQHARRRMFAEMSHELRTPVAVMRGELEAMQDGIRQMGKSAIDSLHSEALGLERLINDLHTLSMSDIGAIDYQMEPQDLASLVTQFLELNSHLIADSNLQLERHGFNRRYRFQADGQRIEQLLSNLLQNTCRYTDEAGKLVVKLSQNNAEGVVENVIDWFDSSPGVCTSAIPKLFDPLFRTEESRSREHGGSGLGLSIAKRIVDAHQGHITARESKLGGLHITIRFPASAL